MVTTTSQRIKEGFLLSLALCILVFPSLVLAGPILRSGDSVSVEADQVLEGDFYGFGSSIRISGEARNDVYLAGASVTVNAPVRQDLVIAGASINVHAPVDDDLRILGGEVTIADHISGDVVVLAGTFTVLSTASIDGDILVLGGEVDINGTVGGSVMGAGEWVRIDAGIGGDVSLRAANSLSLGDRAEILGNLEYESRNDLVRSQGAVVVGDIQKKMIEEDSDSAFYPFVFTTLMLLFAAFTGYLLFKPHMQRMADTSAEAYGTQGLIGLGLLLTLPFVSVLLMASVLGVIVGAMLLIVYLLMLFTAWIMSGVIFGNLLMRYIFKDPRITLVSISLGALAFHFLYFVPFIGPFCMFAIFVIALGGIGTRLYSAQRRG